MKRYVSDRQLAERYSVHRATIWRWSQKGLLPKPVSLSEQCTRWVLGEIEELDEARKRKSREAAV
jgi:predicted DNA-binding transcriptional regulator AlpA